MRKKLNNAKKDSSSINLLAGIANFTNEPLWYRILITIIIAVFIISVIWMIKLWAIPALTIGKGFSLIKNSFH